jgi:hypothetical protein
MITRDPNITRNRCHDASLDHGGWRPYPNYDFRKCIEGEGSGENQPDQSGRNMYRSFIKLRSSVEITTSAVPRSM